MAALFGLRASHFAPNAHSGCDRNDADFLQVIADAAQIVTGAATQADESHAGLFGFRQVSAARLAYSVPSAKQSFASLRAPSR
jgi:hypothetical protein